MHIRGEPVTVGRIVQLTNEASSIEELVLSRNTWRQRAFKVLDDFEVITDKIQQERDQLREQCAVLIKALEEIKDMSPGQWDNEDTQWGMVARKALSSIKD
jgi:hypothetical protein